VFVAEVTWFGFTGATGVLLAEAKGVLLTEATGVLLAEATGMLSEAI
jgi:hypothetical protein